jgi:MoxR-like ATPase
MPPVSDIPTVDPRVDLEIRDKPVPRGSGRSVLPGFGLSLGYTVLYLSLIVLVPLSAAFIKTFGMTWAEFSAAVFSDRVLAVPELTGPDGMLFARVGFNVIATANTRDRGVNEMSAALKRRFNFETVFPIPDFATELALVREETERLLQRAGVPALPGDDVLEVLVTTFRELRAGETADGQAIERLSTAMSTAEAVSVAYAVGVRAHYLAGGLATPADVVDCLAGAAVKDDREDLARLRQYLEQRVPKKKGEHWRAFHAARTRLPG